GVLRNTVRVAFAFALITRLWFERTLETDGVRTSSVFARIHVDQAVRQNDRGCIKLFDVDVKASSSPCINPLDQLKSFQSRLFVETALVCHIGDSCSGNQLIGQFRIDLFETTPVLVTTVLTFFT